MMSMDIEGLDCCSICMGMFDETIRPRNLPCGHTFCTSCIQKAIEDKNLVCAHCKVSHHASNTTEFPISFLTESILSKLREIQFGEPTRSNHKHDTQPYKSRGLSSQMYSVICEQKDNLKSLVEVSNVAEKDVLSYKAFIHDRNEVHKNLTTKTNVIIRDNEEIFGQLEKEENRVTVFLKDGEGHKKEAMNNLMKLNTITKATNILTASEELENVHDSLASWNAKCQSLFPCSKTILQSEKVVKKITKALDLYEDTEDDAPSDVEDLTQTDLSIMEKTKNLMERIKTCEKNVKIGNYNVISIHSGIRILKSEMPFAAQERDGVTRYAKMTSKENKIYLHCLQDIAPPEGSSIIPYDEVIDMVKKDCMISFMDLAWEGSIKGRIHILLSPQTPLAIHFYTLCTAQLGPSYLHTRFIRKKSEILGGFDSVIGGDYERDDGSGGAPLFQGLDNSSDIYRRELEKGSVGIVDYKKDGPRSAQFQIYTRGWEQLSGIFGQVQDGLKLVRKARRLDDIKKVRIEDCGIVLPL